MTDYEKAQAFLELSKVQWGRYDKRRDYEWKVTLGLWTAIAAVTAFLYGKITMTEPHLIVYAIIWLVYTFVWTAGSWNKNAMDWEYALVYMNRVECLLGHASTERQFLRPRYWGFVTDWSRLSQVSTTALFLVLSWYVLAIIPIDHVS